MDIVSLVERLHDEGALKDIAMNPRLQFGTPQRTYPMATVLPEQPVEENAYTETSIRYRTMVANDGSRYSPVQRKKGALVGEFDVKLADSDIGDEFTAREYEALLKILNRNDEMGSLTSVIRWVDTVLNRPLLERNEKARWDAVVNASVVLMGNAGYRETINYSNPVNHRSAASLVWSNNANDPWVDITAKIQLLADKGFKVNRIFSSRRVVNILALNDKVRTRTARIQVNVANGAFTTSPRRATLAEVNEALVADGIPAIEIYDEVYRTMTGTGRFLADTVMVFICTTGRDQSIDLGDGVNTIFLPNTLGYTAIGKAVGQTSPGRVIKVRAYDDKPPRIDGQAWQTSLPVITEPEAIAVITGIA